MNIIVILIIVLLVLAVAGLPHWGYAQSYNYGYFPSGLLGLVLLVLVVLMLAGRL
jgi:flagellin-like protein